MTESEQQQIQIEALSRRIEGLQGTLGQLLLLLSRSELRDQGGILRIRRILDKP